jgi:NAD(P)-dependent dehydrogenase (short-subunit alcohol dehydrogenase family)
VDLLIANAGLGQGDVEDLLRTNRSGTTLFVEALLPMLREGARIIVNTSRLGVLDKISNDVWRERIARAATVAGAVLAGANNTKPMYDLSVR